MKIPGNSCTLAGNYDGGQKPTTASGRRIELLQELNIRSQNVENGRKGGALFNEKAEQPRPRERCERVRRSVSSRVSPRD